MPGLPCSNNAKYQSHWFELTGNQTPDLLQGKSELYRFGHRDLCSNNYIVFYVVPSNQDEVDYTDEGIQLTQTYRSIQLQRLLVMSGENKITTKSMSIKHLFLIRQR